MNIKNIIQDGLIAIWPWYRHRHLFVMVDASDNSVTLSEALCRRMDILNQPEAKVFVFRTTDNPPLYAFMLNPAFKEETQLGEVQYNSKYHTVGFESLCPTVNRIFYDYGIPHDSKAKLSVSVCNISSDPVGNITIYKILRPHV